MAFPEQMAVPVIGYRPKRRFDLNFREIDGETVVVDRQDGLVHQLNATASLIWSCCDGESTVEDIAVHVAAAYEVDFSTAISDVANVIADFRRLRLLAS